MKTVNRLSAFLLAAVILFLGAFPAYAANGAEPAAAQLKNAAAKDTITLVFQDGSEKSYSLDEMRSAVKGTVVLLRDSCLDDDAGCDMTIVYNAMDFAFLKGALKAVIPLTDAQVKTIRNVWRKNDFFEQLYPTIEQDLFRADPVSDGRYMISFGFNVNARVENQKKYDEAMMKKFMAARDRALEIVAGIPGSCSTDYKKLEYLYNYMTFHVVYYDFDKHGDYYWNSGDVVCLLYDALIRHETVCAGYAYSFAYLCELAGIDAQYVTVWTGKDADGSHQAVIAEVNGKNHWFDATWDYGKNQSGFRYFGLSDTELEKRHPYSKTYYSRKLYPPCGSTLEEPAGYWYFSARTYRLRGDNGMKDADIRDGRYSITSALDNRMVLETDGFSTASGGNIQIYENGFIDFQKFDVYKVGNGYGFRNCGSSLMMDVQGGSTAPGTNVWQYESNSTDAQKWLIKDAGNGYCYIKSALGELYLEVTGSSTANCTNVRVAGFTGKDNQRWRFNPA